MKPSMLYQNPKKTYAGLIRATKKSRMIIRIVFNHEISNLSCSSLRSQRVQLIGRNPEKYITFKNLSREVDSIFQLLSEIFTIFLNDCSVKLNAPLKSPFFILVTRQIFGTLPNLEQGAAKFNHLKKFNSKTKINFLQINSLLTFLHPGLSRLSIC